LVAVGLHISAMCCAVSGIKKRDVASRYKYNGINVP